MGKKGGGAKKLECVSHTPISLREEATGKIQTKAASNTKSKLRFEHLKNLAVWATTIPSLGAFYGHQSAACGEATGILPDPSLITCQRCETVLQPGFNSTVRIEQNKSKVRHRPKFGNITQNKVVYKCHFCLHQNLKRGTPKGHIKGICPSKDKSSLESKINPSKSITSDSSKLGNGILSKDEANEINVFPSTVVAKDITLVDDGLATPSSRNTTTLLEGKKRRVDTSMSKNAIKIINKSAKEVAKSAGTSSKRRRKSWTSLKEIAQSNEQKNNQIANLTIPFVL